MKTFATLPLLVALIPIPAQAVTPKTLPADWIGIWEGGCTVLPAETGSAGFKAKLEIKPLSGGSGYSWTLDYNDFSHFSGKSRKYELVPAQDADARHFVMDEKTGLMLDSYFSGRTLYSAYSISGKFYDVSYERTAEGLTMRSPYYDEEPVGSTCFKGSTKLCEKSLQLLGVQDCHLKRKP